MIISIEIWQPNVTGHRRVFSAGTKINGLTVTHITNPEKQKYCVYAQDGEHAFCWKEIVGVPVILTHDKEKQ